MKYFVTGATGFIGGEVVRQLQARGHQVTALVRNPEKAEALSRAGVRLHKGDVIDKESMRAGMIGADGVFHIAAWYKIGVRDRSEAEDINVLGTRNVLQLMRELEIPRGLYTSTVAVFSDTGGRIVDENYRHSGPWLSEYDRTKWMAHYQIAEPMMREGLPLIIVQPGLVYGPGDTSAMHTAFVQYLKGKLPMIPKQTAFCWSHVEDTAAGHLQAFEKGRTGESYIITGPVHTFEEAMETAEQVTGIKAPRIRVPPGLIKGMAGLMKLLGRIIPLPTMYDPESLRVVAGVTYLGSNAKAREELGFKARSLEEGLRETLPHEMEALGIWAPR